MEIKDRLKSMYYKRLYIESLKATLEHDRELIKLFPKYLAELEKDDIERIAQEENELQADLDLINSLDNELQRKVLIERYSHGHNWDKVADDLGYSKAYLSKVHSKAIKQLSSMV
ncbi:Phage protein [Streptococcus infantarius subsp. infantarius]|nr:Phage protein [Streptococcus infantarius subsp. infantarius]MCO4583989.1 Phage protein [Streptococcus infantarius subsp. infantarius]